MGLYIITWLITTWRAFCLKAPWKAIPHVSTIGIMIWEMNMLYERHRASSSAESTGLRLCSAPYPSVPCCGLS